MGYRELTLQVDEELDAALRVLAGDGGDEATAVRATVITAAGRRATGDEEADDIAHGHA